MQLTKMIISDSAIFIGKKTVENRLWARTEFLWGKKCIMQATKPVAQHNLLRHLRVTCCQCPGPRQPAAQRQQPVRGCCPRQAGPG